ncbi:MAG TPA: LUD domain-containing protein [Pirellulales bacterium]|nr:LUD domain-containing protein [Pirellulales bacterium]
MDGKRAILDAVRRHAPPVAPLGDVAGEWIRYSDPRQQFATILESVGGRCQVVRQVDEVGRELANLPAYQEAKAICSWVPGVEGNVDLAAIADPHELATIDFAILPGQFAVAENGAVWVTDESLPHRVIYFISQHLALVVPARTVLNNLHEAYERLSFARPGFGAFISGPSKTADIEQSLVIGAHGARSLTVFLIDEA